MSEQTGWKDGRMLNEFGRPISPPSAPKETPTSNPSEPNAVEQALKDAIHALKWADKQFSFFVTEDDAVGVFTKSFPHIELSGFGYERERLRETIHKLAALSAAVPSGADLRAVASALRAKADAVPIDGEIDLISGTRVSGYNAYRWAAREVEALDALLAASSQEHR